MLNVLCRGRSLADPNKSLLVIAVEKVPATKRQGSGIKQSGFVAGNARLAILPAATAKELGAFVGASVAPGARVITDGFDGYVDLAADFRHYAVIQGEARTPRPSCRRSRPKNSAASSAPRSHRARG